MSPKDNASTHSLFVETILFIAFKYGIRLIKNAKARMLIVLIKHEIGGNSYFT
jgi:hypothetical protein